MPLSEDDQRKLDQIEQAPCQDDPQFAETVNIDRWRRRRIALAGASFTIGMVVLIVGLVITGSGDNSFGCGSSGGTSGHGYCLVQCLLV
jgi:hypothetical protein